MGAFTNLLLQITPSFHGMFSMRLLPTSDVYDEAYFQNFYVTETLRLSCPI